MNDKEICITEQMLTHLIMKSQTALPTIDDVETYLRFMQATEIRNALVAPQEPPIQALPPAPPKTPLPWYRRLFS
jgi:hypothetical protein